MSSAQTVSLTCIRCPRGCQLSATIEDGAVVEVSGNHCKRGVSYAHNECIHPRRTVTSTIPLRGSRHYQTVSVKTSIDIDKEQVFDVMQALAHLSAQVPIHRGDILAKDIAGTKADLVATCTRLH